MEVKKKERKKKEGKEIMLDGNFWR